MNYKLLISSIVAAVFSIIGVCLWSGITMREVTVVEHPYEEGLRYDANQLRIAKLGWKVIVPRSLARDEQLNVQVYDRNGAPVDAAKVELAVNRIDSLEIKKYRALQTDRGSYGAHVECSPQGCWEVKVNVTRGDDWLSYDSRINIGG